MELDIPFIAEDFSVGDRIYLTFKGEMGKGTVTKVGDKGIRASMDNELGRPDTVLSYGIRGMGSEKWGRIPDLSLFEEGTILSMRNKDGSRLFTTIVSYTPGEEITIRYEDSMLGERTFSTSDTDFEAFFSDCEIEG
jgi:hypothetical protein